jgi:hypothetical protein
MYPIIEGKEIKDTNKKSTMDTKIFITAKIDF